MGGALSSPDRGFGSDRRSHLTGHRGFPQHSAEVQQGIKRLLACCRRCDNLREMTTSVSVNVVVVRDICFVSFPPIIIFHLHQLHHGDRVEEVKATKSVQSVGGTGDVRDGQ